MPRLGAYRGKRDPAKTPEPFGGSTGGNATIFVVQKHAARRLHYDFRLERGGVLASWAVPKGIPLEPGAKALAVHVEDHPLDYATFAGEIPVGQYGAGTVEIWDRGTYEPLAWSEERIEVVLRGERFRGRYLLIRFRRKGEREWLMSRQMDRPV